MPQSEIGSKGIDSSIVGSIGNLLLVNDAVNGKLGSKSFSSKLPVLSNQGLPFDIGGVLDKSNWGPDEISNRTKMLGELAYDKIWNYQLKVPSSEVMALCSTAAGTGCERVVQVAEFVGVYPIGLCS